MRKRLGAEHIKKAAKRDIDDDIEEFDDDLEDGSIEEVDKDGDFDADKITSEFYENLMGKSEEEKPSDPVMPEPDENKNKQMRKEVDELYAKEILEDLKEECFSEVEEEPLTVGKISKTNYLYQIFSYKHDKFKSRSFLEQEHKKMIASGYPEGGMLNLYLFMSVTLRRLQIESQQSHKARTKSGSPQSEDFVLLKNIQDFAIKISKVQDALNNAKAAQRAGEDIHDLHNKEVEACAEFVRENAGEFTFKCETCKSIINAGGLPHWAFIIDNDTKGELIYHVWSREMFYMVKKGKMPLYHMAFALQTSIEGLMATAELRGDKLPRFDINEEEEKLAGLMNGFEAIENKRQR